MITAGFGRRALGAAALLVLVAGLLAVRGQQQPAQAATPGDPIAYAVTGQALIAIDATTDVQVAGPIQLPFCPVDLAITPDARSVIVLMSGYACNANLPPTPVAELSMVSTVSNQVVTTVPLAPPATPGGQWPISVAIAPNGGTAYVGLQDPNFAAPGARAAAAPAAVPATGGYVLPVSIGATTLTPNPGAAFPPPSGGSDILAVAASTDGTTVDMLVSNGPCDGTCLETANLQGGEVGRPVRVLGSHSLLESPDGTTAFVARTGDPANYFFGEVDVVDRSARTGSSIDLFTGNNAPEASDLAIGTQLNGTSTLYVADPFDIQLIPYTLHSPITAGSSVLGNVVGVVSNPNNLAVTPDGSRIEITTGRNRVASGTVPPVPRQGTIGCPGGGGLNGCPAAGGMIAMTPDAVLPAFNATAGQAGSASSFDATPSTIAFWTKVQYTWNFGDGTSATTSGPTTNHTYANPGSYTVKLTETDGICTGTNTEIFTGHTMTRECGGPTSRTINVPAKPVPSPSPTQTTPPGTPTLAVDPPIGPPGLVVGVTGKGFPANATVPLLWQPGIGSVTVKADGSGSFHTFILVFDHDRLGPRLLVANGFNANAKFLAVEPSVSPGGQDAQVVFRK